MDQPEVGVLSVDQLGVEDLYAELVLARTRDMERTLSRCSTALALAQGSVCLSEAAAHLRDAAQRCRPAGDARWQRLWAVADALVVEAAAFEHTADALRLPNQTRAG
jgi:hypothetical protein